MNVNDVLGQYGVNLFSNEVIETRVPKSIYKSYIEAINNDEPLSKEVATAIANAMKIWAVEKGATHFTHWFTPMTGLSAEKHDAFLEIDGDKPLLEFSGKTLRKGEPDASSFPSGGLRATFEARGYTAWDTSSSAFVKDKTLYIPTVFCSYNGEALDKKTPLLKSCEVLSKKATELLNMIGMSDVRRVKLYVGAEQEYFLVADEYYQKRTDLKLVGRTLFGAPSPKGQELEDHYFGSIKRKVKAFMKELDEECWKYGIPAKTEHNEVAPAQHELACIYREVNVTADNNQLLMQLLQDIAKKHGLRCLLHEKPFAHVNGSGKHNNWSIVTDSGVNLFNPGREPENNKPFLAMLACVIKAVDEFSDLLRITSATAGNDFRLGSDEAPPAIISIFLGNELTSLVESIINHQEYKKSDKIRFNSGVSIVSDFSKDNTDRNRTSPFAFTGNKFEFRALGSSQSVAGPNIILNSIMAYEIDEMISLIKNGMNLDDIIAKFLSEHYRIIFEGDGYSKEWEIEASRRGLNNYKTAISALEHFTDEKNIRMFKAMGVFNESELYSRRDILLDNYSNTVHVEGATTLKMAQNEIYPSVIRYLKDLSTTVNEMEKCGVNADYLKDDLSEISALCANLKTAMTKLKEGIIEYDELDGDSLMKARKARQSIFERMEEVRRYADLLEMHVDEKIWPFPSYIDLMFGI